MIFYTKRVDILSLMRKAGYTATPFSFAIENEPNFIKPLSGRYPRFHVFIKTDKDCEFNLHLDQKAPSYKGSSAHSAEYEGEIIEKEAERIKSIAESL